MAPRSLLAVCLLVLLLALLQPPQVWSQGFSLEDALDDDQKPESVTTATTTTTTTTTTKAKVVPKVPTGSKAPAKPKPAGSDLELSDALDSNNDMKEGKDKDKKPGGSFSDQDLIDIGNDDSYKPDKGKGGRPSGDRDHINQYDDSNGETTAEVGTIAGIASAVAMALVGAITSYISYQKKKLCFSIQQSLNTDMVKAENPEAVVATEPQVQQTLLQSANAEPPTEENAV